MHGICITLHSARGYGWRPGEISSSLALALCFCLSHTISHLTDQIFLNVGSNPEGRLLFT